MHMKQVSLLIASFAMLLVGCGESKLPTATGKGAVRAINAIPASPPVAFLIEERVLGVVEFQDSSAAEPYDDLSYRFNFDIIRPGDSERTRFASINQQIVKDREFIFVVSGTLNNPSVTVWEGDERDWDGTETVFEVRFGHLAETFGPVDIYFADETMPPMLGAETASLSTGEINTAALFDGGNYVVTVTSPGEPSDILYQSDVITFAPQTTLVITLFDGDENDLHPLAVRALRQAGANIEFPDRNTMPEIRFIQLSRDLPLADIFVDDTLTTPFVEDHAFGDVTPDIPNAVGTKTITYTPANDSGSTFLDRLFAAIGGTRVNFYTMGPSGDYESVVLIADRRSISTAVNFSMLHAASNQGLVDIYIVDSGVSIENEIPVAAELSYTEPTGALGIGAGVQDLYVTTFDEKTVLAGPFSIDVALGDVIETVLIDTVDPATAEIRIIPTP